MTTKAKKAPRKAAPAVATALVLRVCSEDMTSHGGFRWPATVGALVSAPDWNDAPVCGYGLHGWLYGQGDHSCANHHSTPGAKWLVVEVVASEIVMLGGKCKFPRCTVRHVGDKVSATAYLIANEPKAANVAVIGASVTVGEKQSALVGALGTATAGDRGTATAGYRGTATAGDRGTATAGDRGTATAGDSGTATAGDSGELRLRYYDAHADRYRTVIAYVGENGIKPNTPYRLNDARAFVEVKP